MPTWNESYGKYEERSRLDLMRRQQEMERYIYHKERMNHFHNHHPGQFPPPWFGGIDPVDPIKKENINEEIYYSLI